MIDTFIRSSVRPSVRLCLSDLRGTAYHTDISVLSVSFQQPETIANPSLHFIVKKVIENVLEMEQLIK